MKKALLTGTISCAISIFFWSLIFLFIGIGGDAGYAALGLWLLWISVGLPVAAVLSIISMYQTYMRPIKSGSSSPASILKAKIVSGVSLALVVTIPILNEILTTKL